MQIRISYIFIALLLYPGYLWSQAKTDTPKIKPPKMESFWGISRGGNITIEQILPMLDSAINVIAEKKTKMTIAKAILVYRSKDFYEDESTGTVKIRYNSYSYNYQYNDKIPDNWKRFLKENIKAGDQLIIGDIHIKTKEGYLFNAPDLKITIN